MVSSFWYRVQCTRGHRIASDHIFVYMEHERDLVNSDCSYLGDIKIYIRHNILKVIPNMQGPRRGRGTPIDKKKTILRAKATLVRQLSYFRGCLLIDSNAFLVRIFLSHFPFCEIILQLNSIQTITGLKAYNFLRILSLLIDRSMFN